jgi:hypothetical protein
MDIIDKGIEYLKGKVTVVVGSKQIYDQAMMFYVFALSNESVDVLFKKLNGSVIAQGNTYWTNDLSPREQIEVAAYVVLGLTRLNDMAYLQMAQPLYDFITAKLIGNDEIIVLGQQAVYEASAALESKLTEMTVQIRSKSKRKFNKSITITPSNMFELQKIQVPHDIPDVEVFATGQGSASVSISSSFKTDEIVDDLEFFAISVSTDKQGEWLELQICAGTIGEQFTNMVKMEVRLPSGYVHHTGPSGNEPQLWVWIM